MRPAKAADMIGGSAAKGGAFSRHRPLLSDEPCLGH